LEGNTSAGKMSGSSEGLQKTGGECKKVKRAKGQKKTLGEKKRDLGFKTENRAEAGSERLRGKRSTGSASEPERIQRLIETAQRPPFLECQKSELRKGKANIDGLRKKKKKQSRVSTARNGTSEKN